MIKKLLFIGILIAIGLYVSNYLLQKEPVTDPEPTVTEEVIEENTPEVEQMNENVSEPTAQSEDISSDSEISEEGIQVDESLISDEQKELLERFGIDTSAITVTAEMIACAEEKVGAERIEEIKNGATPGFLEGLSLVTCY